MRTTPLPALLLLSVLAGSCTRPSRTAAKTEPAPLQLPPRGAAASPMSDLKPLPTQESILINSGPLPLVHLFDQGGRVRIVNATTKQTLLAESVAAGSIISVSDSGILIGRQRRLTTSLKPGQRYEIWWDLPTGR